MAPPDKPWKASPIPEYREALEFLEQLRPGGPWVLTAIVPDGQTTTLTATTPHEARHFVHAHNGKQNLYYSLNPTRHPVTRKANKGDISQIEFLHADLDPKAEETPDQAKERYYGTLSVYNPGSTALIDSGNGVQALWRLHKPVVLPQPDDKRQLTEEGKKIIADVEARIANILIQLGGTLGTQNVDRILRLPGTINIPNAKKKKEGRVECPTKVIWFNSSTHLVQDFEPAEAPAAVADPNEPLTDETVAKLFAKLPANIKKLIASPGYQGEDRSETAAATVYDLKQRVKLTDAQIVALFKAHPKGIGERYSGNEKKLQDDIARIQRKYVNGSHVISAPKSSLVIRASEILPRAKDWLWEGHLLRGAQELMTGAPGLGKSQAQISFIACATTGAQWPNGAKGCVPINVIMLTAEDTIEQEVVPRLLAAGANLERVSILKWIKADGQNRQFLLSEDLDELERIVSEIGDVGLITVDPITAYMGAKMDSHKATEVRAQLGPLKDFAEKTGIAISTITHPPKSAGSKAIDQFIGSQAFIAAGRIGHVCVEEYETDEETEERNPTGRVLFTNCKNNAGVRMPTMAFHVEQKFVSNDHVTNVPIQSPRAIWDGEVVGVTADQAVADATALLPRKRANRQQDGLQNVLVAMLTPGPMTQKEVQERVAIAGYTPNQLRTAKEKLNIASKQGPDGWVWSLMLSKTPDNKG